MSLNSQIRTAALALFVVAGSAGLSAQTDKDQKEKDQRKEAPRPQRKGPAPNTSTPPATPPASRPAPIAAPPPSRPAPATAQPANPPAARPDMQRDRPVRDVRPPQDDRNVRPAVPVQRDRPVPQPAQTDRPPVRQDDRNVRPAVPNVRPDTPARQPGYQPADRGGNPNQGNNPNNGRQFGNGGNNPNPNANRRPNDPGIRNGAPGMNTPTGNRPAVYHGANGSEVRYRPNGQPDTVRARGITITHAPTGVRRTEFERPDHSVIVTHGSNHGYVQRPYVVNNVTFVQRTYYAGGRSYSQVYRPYQYHGISLNLYVSSRYYPPAYYGWAYSPWYTPVSYRWGWYNDPWYGYYGGYFRPYPTYASAAFWLTDYILSTTLERAYQERMDAAAAQAGAGYTYSDGAQTALTPEVKQAISEEVRRQLDQERAESQAASQNQGDGAAPQFLSDNSTHVFVVASGFNVTSRWGECSLSEGDVLQMSAPPAPTAASADLTVLASKGQDCYKGSVVSVSIPDLQDMQNHMRSTLDQGLNDLQSKQGQGGIPMAPQAAQRGPVQTPYAAAAPPPDSNIADEVRQQSQTAQQAEGEVLSQAQDGSQTADNGPTTVTLGMSIEQVTALLGRPQVVADLGSKKTYFYGNMKVLFTDGKVTEVQ